MSIRRSGSADTAAAAAQAGNQRAWWERAWAFLGVAVAVAILAAPSEAAAGGSVASTPTQVAYVSSTIDNTVSVVNTATNTVTGLDDSSRPRPAGRGGHSGRSPGLRRQ